MKEKDIRSHPVRVAHCLLAPVFPPHMQACAVCARSREDLCTRAFASHIRFSYIHHAGPVRACKHCKIPSSAASCRYLDVASKCLRAWSLYGYLRCAKCRSRGCYNNSESLAEEARVRSVDLSVIGDVTRVKLLLGTPLYAYVYVILRAEFGC